MATWESMQWGGDEQSADERRRLRNGLVASGVCHLLAVALLGLSPRPAPSPALNAISIDLVASLPGAPKPAPAAKTAPPPPKPVPVAVPPPPKPQAKILPKHAPDPVAKPRAKPEPEVERKPRPKELSYDDALAALRNQLGEPKPAPETAEASEASDAPSDADLLALAKPGAGVRVSPEEAAWILATRRHIRGVWITPPEFLNRGISTELRVQLSGAGEVLGTPQVLRSSGDPFADDNAVRALLKASPLPPPPQAGPRNFIFEPEERS